MATWQTPSGGGGYWIANGDGIYNNNSENIGIGTNSPITKLHVEGGTVYANNSNYSSLYINTTGIGTVGAQFHSQGPAINAQGSFGIEATETNTGVIGNSTAQNDGVGVSGVAECATCDTLRATSEYGTALYVVRGNVVDNGGRWSRRYDINGLGVSEINIFEASDINDMVYGGRRFNTCRSYQSLAHMEQWKLGTHLPFLSWNLF